MKIIIIITSLLISVFAFTQDTITYNQLQTTKKKIKGNFSVYISKNNEIYKIGDTLKFGKPSNDKEFAYIYVLTGTAYFIPSELYNKITIIKKIRISASEISGWHIEVQTYSKGRYGNYNYYISLENAISKNEIYMGIMSQYDALIELKKYKEKYDLGLITEDEYNKKKKELAKIIK